MNKRSNVFIALCAALVLFEAQAHHTGGGLDATGTGSILTASGDTLPQGKWGTDFRLSYRRFQRFSDVEMVQAAERGVNLESEKDAGVYTLGLAYGVTNDLTFSVSAPWVFRHGLESGEFDDTAGVGVVNEEGDSAGRGDMSFLVKYRFLKGEHGSLAFLGGVQAPTGSTNQSARDGGLQEVDHQPGSRAWNPVWGLAWSKRQGAWGLDADAIHTNHREGARGVTLGDTFQVDLAFSRRLSTAPKADCPAEDCNCRVWTGVMELNYANETQDKTPDGRNPNSGGHTLNLTPGVRVGIGESWSAYAAIPIPLSEKLKGEQQHVSWQAVVGISKSF